MRQSVRQWDSMRGRQKQIKSQRNGKKDKRPSRSQQIERERQRECKRERWEGRMAERALRQRGEKNAARSRHRANGPTTVNIMALCGTHTHAHTHTRLANGPPSCPIRNCLISCAKQPLPCQPWCHLLPNNMAADQTSTRTHKHTSKHTKTHSEPHTWHCPAAVTQRHTHQTSQTQV